MLDVCVKPMKRSGCLKHDHTGTLRGPAGEHFIPGDRESNTNLKPLGDLMQLNILPWQKTALPKAQSCAKRPKHF
jgi:hypothetical protein